MYDCERVHPNPNVRMKMASPSSFWEGGDDQPTPINYASNQQQARKQVATIEQARKPQQPPSTQASKQHDASKQASKHARKEASE